jgi:hypothetical protein
MPQYNREEALRIAAEKLRRKAEKEKREENEFYERITSGTPWFLFKIVVAFCTLMVVLTTIEVFVDGKTKKLDEKDWKIDRQLYLMGHQSIKTGDYLFVASFQEWMGHVDTTFEITYSPIFRTGKMLSYDQKVSEATVIRQEVIRRRSIFTWFPYFQILMLLPLFTFIFKAQKPWFNFARVGSMVIVLPGILLVLILTLL